MLKFFVLKNRERIDEIPPETQNVHVAFRPSDKDVFLISKRCSDLKRLHIAPSYAESLSETTQMFLDMQEVELIVSNEFWGHRSDKKQYAVMEEPGE